ncbi:MAG: ABC transporter permease subunit [Chloroflexi bacterium]|nr:ABC transporter permease subunit [Chloroflexota bacterium]
MRKLQLETPRVPVGRGVEVAVDWGIIYLSPVLETIKLSVSKVFVAVETAFQWLPWPVWILLVGVLGWRLASLRTGLLVLAALSVVQAVGLWNEAMSTMALVVAAVILTLIIAIPIGVLAAHNNFLESIIRPVLDAMQTIPGFVYLIPVVMLLGVGKVPAVIATMVFAIPPAIRLTNLGLRQVSAETKEAAISFGASKWQLLTKVELPLAARTIMAGVNQSTMMSVSMVIIAAFIGAGGLGYSVLFALNRVRIGSGFEAGLAILAIAIVLDRLTQALAKTNETGRAQRSG